MHFSAADPDPKAALRKRSLRRAVRENYTLNDE